MKRQPFSIYCEKFRLAQLPQSELILKLFEHIFGEVRVRRSPNIFICSRSSQGVLVELRECVCSEDQAS